MEGLKSGTVAKEARINVETLRFYEKNGMLPKPRRDANGYRIYLQDDVSKLKFIKKCKALGFTLKEIKELLFLKKNKKESAIIIKDRVENKISEIQEKIISLKKLEESLQTLSGLCIDDCSIGECPILDVMDNK